MGHIKFAKLVLHFLGGKTKSKTQYKDFDNSGISTTPNGEIDGVQTSSQKQSATPSKIIPRIRGSKSMQNLDRLTRDSYYNLREVTSDIKERYHSRMELNRSKPRSNYDEFLDEHDSDNEEDIYERDFARSAMEAKRGKWAMAIGL